MLEALSFELWGISPFTLLCDVWDAMPSIQLLLRLCGHNWTHVLSEVEQRLNRALLGNDPELHFISTLCLLSTASDMLRFGTSLLTGGALLAVLFDSLVLPAHRNRDHDLAITNAAADVERDLQRILKAKEVRPAYVALR